MTGKDPAATARACRCEGVIPASILTGYACGSPDCWRTAEVASSFASFVEDLKRNRQADAGSVEDAER